MFTGQTNQSFIFVQCWEKFHHHSSMHVYFVCASRQRRVTIFLGAVAQTESPPEVRYHLMVSEVSLQQTGQTQSVIQPLSEQETIQTSQARVQGKCLVLGRPSSVLSSQSLAVKLWTVAINRPSSLALPPVSQALKVLSLLPMAPPELLAGRTCFHLQNWRKITADPWCWKQFRGTG